MNFRKNSKGITLIALVITIIVLLILAGVSLSLITGSDGILGRAEKAVVQTNISSGKEQAELLIADYLSEYYEEAYVNANQSVASQAAEEYIQSKITADGVETSSGDYFVTVGSDNAITVYRGTSAEESEKIAEGILSTGGKIEWSDETTSGDSGDGSGGTTSVNPEDLTLGATVKYSPSGTFNWEAQYVSSDLATDGTADVALASGTQVTDGKTDMSITEWKVFSVDESTGAVRLVPASPTSNEIRLQGAQGYNNAVKMLNDACSNLYGDSSKGITAESIDIDDIEGVMTEAGKTTAHSYVESGTYGNQVSSAYTSYKKYPTIYAQENLSVINGTINNTGLGMSEQSALIGRTDNGATIGKLTASTSIQPYYTYYYLSNSDFTSALQDGYSSVLLPNGSSTNYWIASRCVYTLSNHCYFRVRSIENGYLGANIIDYSSEYTNKYSRSLFPIVSLSSNHIKLNASGEFVVE